MTTPSDQQPREAGIFTTIRSWGITRGDNGFLGGVVDGTAQRIGMATVPARIVLVIVAMVLNGLVLIAYAAAWAVLPDRRGNIIIQNFGRGMPNVGALIGIALIALFGMGGLDHSGPFSIGDFSWDSSSPWAIIARVLSVTVPLAFLGGLVWFIVVLVRREQPTSPTPHAAPARPADAQGQDADTGPADSSAPVYAAVPTRVTSATVPPARPATQPAPAAAPARPVSPAPPMRPKVPGPGRGFYLATLAWFVLSGAVVSWLAREDQLGIHPAIAWFVTLVTGLGVLLVFVSLAGRKLGFLGFMTIAMALPLPLIAAGADELRDAYANDGSLLHINLDNVTVEWDSYDATSDFSTLYTTVIINGTCHQESTVVSSSNTTARLTYATLADDTSVDVTAEVTYVTIAEGTNVTVRGIGDAQAHVVWPDRNISCDFWDAGGTHLSLLNPNSPTLDLVVRDDDYANTIVLTEVQS